MGEKVSESIVLASLCSVLTTRPRLVSISLTVETVCPLIASRLPSGLTAPCK